MYAIIRNTNCIDDPKNGWGKCPDKNDIELADDIERVRHSRNVLSHLHSLEMDTKDFNRSVLDLIGVICNGFLIYNYLLFST